MVQELPKRGNHIFVVVALVALAAGISGYGFVFKPNHDTAWLLMAAERLLEGGNYLDDFYETNPPSAILIYVPAVLLAKLLGAPFWPSFLAFMIAMILASSLVLRAILVTEFKVEERLASNLVLIFGLISLFLPAFHFGQREHIGVVLLIPYATMTGCYLRRGAVANRRIEIAASLLGAIGSMIKPPMVLVPATLILYRAFSRREIKQLFRPDFAVYVIVGLSYTATVILLFPEYREVAGDLILVYNAFSDPSYERLLAATVFVAAASLGAWLFIRKEDKLREAGISLLITGFVSYTVFMIQRKGWLYHAIPFIFVFVLIFTASVTLWISRRRLQRFGEAAILFAILGALLTANIGIHIKKGVTMEAYENKEFVRILKGHSEADCIAVFATSLDPYFPEILIEKRKWASRFAHLWLLPGVAQERKRDGSHQEALNELEDRAVTLTVNDLNRYKPDLIIVDTAKEKQGFKDSFDFVQFFDRSDRFRATFSSYHLIQKSKRYDVFARYNAPNL